MRMQFIKKTKPSEYYNPNCTCIVNDKYWGPSVCISTTDHQLTICPYDSYNGQYCNQLDAIATGPVPSIEDMKLITEHLDEIEQLISVYPDISFQPFSRYYIYWTRDIKNDKIRGGVCGLVWDFGDHTHFYGQNRLGGALCRHVRRTETHI